jgi:hypothetical protein
MALLLAALAAAELYAVEALGEKPWLASRPRCNGGLEAWFGDLASVSAVDRLTTIARVSLLSLTQVIWGPIRCRTAFARSRDSLTWRR